MDLALVLGAGGLTGIAWHLGLLAGLREQGVDLTGADLIVGTSAGAVAGALLAGGLDPVDAARLEARLTDADPPMQPDWARGTEVFGLLNDTERDPASVRAAVGTLALAADVVAEEPYVIALGRRLPSHDWPDRPLLITAVDAATGHPVTWDRTSGVPLDRAVAASCAVPCIFPPVTMNGSRYMDGGVRSLTNADLATGAARVVVLSPLSPTRTRARGTTDAELDTLRRDTRDTRDSRDARATRATLVVPDAEALDALGSNVFDATRWDPAFDAARAQGHRVAPAVSAACFA
ncbi:patatin-like phospholipase family protein [Catenuloplanes sp. NPDC051500]|uniref:patatin-like phospholipase family protein n=1 Tax=Catenuloplanes sp. NPDC051500 TaxID=3363959 RepID=UPI003795A252